MLFSILIANYNNGHFFKDCYQSIITQTYTNWEVIIVDDCSTDDSVSVLKEIIGNDYRFKIFLNEENKGCGYTKNKCAKLATGEILGFLDPDDALRYNALELMVDLHKKNNDVAIITSKYEFVDLEMNFINLGGIGGVLPEGKSHLTAGIGSFTHFATFKNKCFDKTGGLDVKMKRAVDQDLYFKLEEQGKHLFLDKVLYSYRMHENSISNNENVYKAEYWSIYAKKKAFKRRLKTKKSAINFTKDEIDKMLTLYFFSRFERVKGSNKVLAKYYFLMKSILASPSHKLWLKIKSLMLVSIGRI